MSPEEEQKLLDAYRAAQAARPWYKKIFDWYEDKRDAHLWVPTVAEVALLISAIALLIRSCSK